ncbi:uncharacterized protein LOC129593306 [Paramacrobiotus metropolitanus]|uniref:uncharacterized protein LOC129593306 n=1 Tax=Paramacrobiotus metropolitanus TaxID=2943436 RepID=UPI002445A4B0|nr:uncharacterized protein LOC129593306 [Paramacrobiotus metropolitanus]
MGSRSRFPEYAVPRLTMIPDDLALAAVTSPSAFRPHRAGHVALLCMTFSLLLMSWPAAVHMLPLLRDTDASPTAAPYHIHNGDECNYMGKMPSDDPCSPWCFCRNGRAACAQVTCTPGHSHTGDPSAPCHVIHVSGRCCPTFLCSLANGTTSVKYDLPMMRIPDEMLPLEDHADDKD